MEVGFDSIGNATLICYDKGPVLATDPWLDGSTYFGSWILKNPIPKEQKEAISQCPFIWISHGHPDHLSPNSLEKLKGKTILLPAHVGQRIESSLVDKGHKVQIVSDRTWIALSERIRIFCIADYNQDAVLLIDLAGRLIFNMNDASDHGWARSVNKIIRQYDTSILLRGSSLADMANFYDEDGNFIPPIILQSGPYLSNLAKRFGVTHFIPFSANHFNQRSDSFWAEEFSTPYEDYHKGFDTETCQILPPFVRFSCSDDTFEKIEVTSQAGIIKDPAEFGDNWSDLLSKEDIKKLEHYFQSIAHLFDFLDFINIRVGGKDHFISFNTTRFKRGITFEAPRNSLMICIEHQIFDDMLIGNYMKTTLHGQWSETKLYPDFSPYVAKFADNGYAKSREELNQYFEQYRRRAPFEFLIHRLELQSKNLFRNFVRHDSGLYRVARDLYHRHA